MLKFFKSVRLGVLLFIVIFMPIACASPATSLDSDKDGVIDSEDNCPEVANPSQTDENADGRGDLCEPIVGCGDGLCDLEGGECDVYDYCKKDCTRSRCFGLADNSTCGDGLCDPLAGECSRFGPCLDDCPDSSACFPGTCGNGICEAWEDNPLEAVSFCIFDCGCLVNLVSGDCEVDLDCAGHPGTLCAFSDSPEGEFNSFEELIRAYLQISCHCTTCGNGALDAGEGCDPSLGFENGIQACVEQGLGCDQTTCECRAFFEQNCEDGIDEDDNGLTDCMDPECLLDPACEEVPPVEPLSI